MKSKIIKLNNPKVRKLRICNRHFQRTNGFYARFPDIRLSGRWLQESGFEAGQYVKIVHERHKIVIMLNPKKAV